MASNGYPKIPSKAWTTLRSRAASAPSTKFTPPFVAALMGMSSPESAASNTVRPMRRVGLIDDEGSLTARGNKWRVDASYADACQEILADVYPSDLASLTDESGAPDSQRVRTWFDHKGFGDSNARQMASTYLMIAKKAPPAVGSPEVASSSTRGTSARRARPARSANHSDEAVLGKVSEPETAISRSNGSTPNVHLDIQIHIPAAASPEQIDHIFESMARHLYRQ